MARKIDNNSEHLIMTHVMMLRPGARFESAPVSKLAKRTFYEKARHSEQLIGSGQTL